MFLTILSVSIGATLVATCTAFQLLQRRRRRSLNRALQSGLVIDDHGNIDTATTYATMARHESEQGSGFNRKQSRFMKLMQICAEGPTSIEEIRFLFDEGIEPVVRPDGVVYVPCIENEHLHMEGEIELLEEDLDSFIEQQKIKLDASLGISNTAGRR